MFHRPANAAEAFISNLGFIVHLALGNANRPSDAAPAGLVAGLTSQTCQSYVILNEGVPYPASLQRKTGSLQHIYWHIDGVTSKTTFVCNCHH